MKCIVWQRPDGGVSITYPANPCPESMSEQEHLDAVAARFIETNPEHATYVRVADVENTTIPTDRTFRDAWKADLSVDMEKAREIHRNYLRRLRAPKLEELDIAYQRADEIGDTAQKLQIAQEKQALRDVTTLPEIAEAATPDALKTVVPAILK